MTTESLTKLANSALREDNASSRDLAAVKFFEVARKFGLGPDGIARVLRRKAKKPKPWGIVPTL